MANKKPWKADRAKCNAMAFFASGFIVHTLVNVVYSAAEDILAETSTPTSVVYMHQTIPYLVGSLLVSAFIDQIPPLWIVSATFLLEISGIFLLSFGKVAAKLTAVSPIALSQSLANVGFLSLSALYEDITVSAYSAASGMGLLFAAIYYTGMTAWLDLSMETTLMSMIWTPCVILGSYWLMEKKKRHLATFMVTTTHKIPYRPLDSSSVDDEERLTIREKLRAIWNAMPLALPLFHCFFAKFLLLQALVTTSVFSNAPFSPRDHYLYYFPTVMVGEMSGRILGLAMRCCACEISDYAKHTWMFDLLAVTCVIFQVLAAWFLFLENVLVVFLVCFVVGFCTGATFNCSFAAVPSGSSQCTREISRAFLVFPTGVGSAIASLTGFCVEPRLKERCIHLLNDLARCMIRSE